MLLLYPHVSPIMTYSGERQRGFGIKNLTMLAFCQTASSTLIRHFGPSDHRRGVISLLGDASCGHQVRKGGGRSDVKIALLCVVMVVAIRGSHLFCMFRIRICCSSPMDVSTFGHTHGYTEERFLTCPFFTSTPSVVGGDERA